ncbi:MAG: hypothetical protein II838_08175 [Lachnospiraceae bacterium]|nr:hypothetical protein [Lachnospiraceae bacterium]
MDKWKFPSRDFAETEGFSNAGLAEFKGHPLKALAREVCQNSLDAANGSGKPVRVEFHNEELVVNRFPGMEDMKRVIKKCDEFWGEDGDANTKQFLAKAKEALECGTFCVLRISDYHTKGVQGAFSDKHITPWGGLVKGNSFSVKTDEKNAQGSYGIGKAAPFVSSAIQTIFYRTYDTEGVRAALGVARLMAHELEPGACKEEEDPIRRAVGYFGEQEDKKPSVSIEELDRINVRRECGTDLFIPAFTLSTKKEAWINEILLEIVDNFLYSIYAGKLEVAVNGKEITKENLPEMLVQLGARAKAAKMFYEVIREDNEDVLEVTQDFHNLGLLKMRLLYGPDLNKKVLIVRNSGMKIAKIATLPKGMSYVGFLELQGDKLNEMFRGMENPKHNAWEPKRHDDPKLAKVYKEEVENWVRSIINQKITECCGEEDVLDMGDCLKYVELEQDQDEKSEASKREALIDNAIEISIDRVPVSSSKTFKIREKGAFGENCGMTAGTVDPNGTRRGHRHRSGKTRGGRKTGRPANIDPNGIDQVYAGAREVEVSARIISKGEGVNRLIFYSFEDISLGEMEVVTKGENGKTLQLYVQSVVGENVSVDSGHIVISNIKAKEKHSIDFKIAGNKKYAMGVRAYGN